ncbi:MAG TPA: right-handed parallel beta-helix repeat-containing protein [Planctomycetota bacterium]|nr:right-handed parallel beta-helix repeat-containing protein [Planctomycetota bacterium]
MRRRHPLLLVLALGARLVGSDAITPGEITTPWPTITNLAVEWAFTGDDDADSVVDVRFRAAGAADWREAMRLRRVVGGPSQTVEPVFTWATRHSGSILDVLPDTEYEIALTLADPDGGGAERTVRARTRPVPRAAEDAPVRQVDPTTIRSLQPGEIGLLAAGDYGEFYAPRDGEPGRPIVLRSLDGGAVFTHISLHERKWVFIEGVTVRNPAPDSTGIKMNFAERCVVRRCTIDATYGIRATQIPGARECYIADNTITGVTPWTSEAMGAGGKNIGEGIEFTGPGNVICFNRVRGHRDCISSYEATPTEQICVDIIGNDVSVGADDGIEADFLHHNGRVLRNRLTNCFVGISSQPGFGGPNYFVRNVMYNLAYAPFKLHRGSVGDVVLHNTVVKCGDGMACFSGTPFDQAYFRNNLCIGGPNGGEVWGGYGSGNSWAAHLAAHGPLCSFDYDALGTWQTPFHVRIGSLSADSIEELRKGPHEQHAVQVGMDVFDGVAFPDPPLPEREAPDLRPRAGSPVVDAALRLPNVNDAFAGAGPDMGAYEAGQPLPHYGPRPVGVDESTPPADAKPAKSAKLKPAKAALDPGPHRVAIETALRAVGSFAVETTMTVMGDERDVAVMGADDSGLRVTVREGTLPLRWSSVSDLDLARVTASACRDDAVTLGHAWHLAGAARDQKLRDAIARRLLEIDPAAFKALRTPQ